MISAHFCLHFRTLWARFWIHCGGFVDFFNKQTNEAARQQDSKTATRKEENQTATQEPNIPTTKRFGSAECAKRLKFAVPRQGCWRVRSRPRVYARCRTRRACLSLPLRRALRGPSFRTNVTHTRAFFRFFSVFFGARKND